MVKEIPLTKGKVALVDDEDYEQVNQYKWCSSKGRNTFYVMTRGPIGKNIRLHCFLLDPKKDEQVDHINGDGLDNRKCNLRIATNAQNIRNSQKHVDGSSKFKGVSWYKQRNIWNARIYAHKKQRHLGYFVNEIDAALAYDAAAKKYYGEFANLNFP